MANEPLPTEEQLLAALQKASGEEAAKVFRSTLKEATELASDHKNATEERRRQILEENVLGEVRNDSGTLATLLGSEAFKILKLNENDSPKFMGTCREAADRAVSSWWRGYFASDPDNSDKLFDDAAFHVIMFVASTGRRFAEELVKLGRR